MIALLSKIWCVISHLDCYLVYGGKAIVNAIVLALVTAANFLLNAIPVSMPAAPTLPDPLVTVLGWIAWIFPVHTVYLIVEFMILGWLAWQAVVIVLRWAKATDA